MMSSDPIYKRVIKSLSKSCKHRYSPMEMMIQSGSGFAVMACERLWSGWIIRIKIKSEIMILQTVCVMAYVITGTYPNRIVCPLCHRQQTKIKKDIPPRFVIAILFSIDEHSSFCFQYHLGDIESKYWCETYSYGLPPRVKHHIVKVISTQPETYIWK